MMVLEERENQPHHDPDNVRRRSPFGWKQPLLDQRLAHSHSIGVIHCQNHDRGPTHRSLAPQQRAIPGEVPFPPVSSRVE